MKKYIFKDEDGTYIIEANSKREALKEYNQQKIDEFALEDLWGLDESDIL